MVISTIARGASANPAHAVTVALAIILMVVHAARPWRAYRFRAAVRTIWPIPHFCGLMGVPAIGLSPNAALGAAGAIGLTLHLRGDKRAA